jgi:Archease protein family (MTH1598/TM1083)
MPTVAGYELLEHTADLGIRAWAPTAPEAFEHAARALAAAGRGDGKHPAESHRASRASAFSFFRCRVCGSIRRGGVPDWRQVVQIPEGGLFEFDPARARLRPSSRDIGPLHGGSPCPADAGSHVLPGPPRGPRPRGDARDAHRGDVSLPTGRGRWRSPSTPTTSPMPPGLPLPAVQAPAAGHCDV